MTDRIMIRPMTTEDATGAAAIEAVCFSDGWSLHVYEETLRLPYAYYYAAERDGEIIGTIGLTILGGDGEITNVAVLPAYRKQGIASDLMQAVLDRGHSLGTTDFTLEVRAGNTAAIALYERYGFVTEGIRKKFYTNPIEDALIMWRRDEMNDVMR